MTRILKNFYINLLCPADEYLQEIYTEQYSYIVAGTH